MIDSKEMHLREIVPTNLMRDKKVADVIEATGNEEKKGFLCVENSIIRHLNNQSDEVIWHLLWENHIIENKEGLALAKTKEEKIALIEAAVELHMYKGTPYAIERLLEVIGLNGDVQEWFQYTGDPFHFKVELATTNISNDTLTILRQLIQEYKNKRSWLDFIALKMPQTQYIEIDSAKYHYPVYFPICGTFVCEGMPGVGTDKTIEIKTENYTYPVYLPVCGEFYTNEVMDTW